jgi:putative glutamine amidotransferase
VSESSSKPIIGLTTYLEQAQTGVWDVPASFLPKVYFSAVNKAGGIAVLLPPQPVDAEIANAVLDGLDGIIITGGKDVDSARYGEEPHPENDDPRTDRDTWEDALLTAAIDRGVPFLGICRGMQLLNVSRGGSLVQHLPDVVGSNRYNLGEGNFNDNAVEIEPGSKLADVVGSPPGHQAGGGWAGGDRALGRRHRAGDRVRGQPVRHRRAVASRARRRGGRAPLRGPRGCRA